MVPMYSLVVLDTVLLSVDANREHKSSSFEILFSPINKPDSKSHKGGTTTIRTISIFHCHCSKVSNPTEFTTEKNTPFFPDRFWAEISDGRHLVAGWWGEEDPWDLSCSLCWHSQLSDCGRFSFSKREKKVPTSSSY